MKFVIKFVVSVMMIQIIQGCSPIIPIKTQTSIGKIADCISGPNSHGLCTDNQPMSFSNSSIPDSNSSYFNALNVMTIPKSIEIARLTKFSGEASDGSSTLFNKYSEKYVGLDCTNIYNYEAAKIAKNTFSRDSNKNIHELFTYQLKGNKTFTSNSSVIEFNVKDFNNFIDELQQVDSYGGIESLQCAAVQNMSYAKNETEINEIGSLLEELSYIKEYFKAYFHNGKFIQGKVKVDELYKRLTAKIKDKAQFLSEDQIKNYAEQLFKDITGKKYSEACPEGETDCEIAFLGKLDTSQFVTRSGDEYGFPHVAVSFDPLAEKKISATKIDWNKVGAEISKIYIEAVGDKLIGLPADPKSTACKINSALCYSEEKGGISADNFSAVAEHADKIDALVSNAVGKAIRGVGWISLNNEAVASIIESTVGTVAKKAAEKVAYCTYSCIKENKQTLNNFSSESSLEEVKVKVSY